MSCRESGTSNHYRRCILVVIAALCLRVAPLHAQAPGADSAPTPIPNSQNNFQGDLVTFPVNVTVAMNDGTNSTWVNVCLPVGTYIRGVGQTTDGTYYFRVDCSWRDWILHKCKAHDIDACSIDQATQKPANIKVGSTIRVTKAQMDLYPPNRFGLTYGALVVPFKFELTGQKEFKGSASLGPYLGYQIDKETFGAAISLVAFAGVSNNSATKTTTTASSTSGTPTTKTTNTDLAGFSYGGGLLGTVKGGFQLGAVVGFDHVGSGQGFQYNDKPWLAFELGYSFSQ